MNWRKLVPQFFTKQWNFWVSKVEGSLVTFVPSYVSKENTLFSPLISLVALITAILVTGLAIGSFFTLFTSLLVLYFIMTKIFGIDLELGDVVQV